MRIAEYNKKIAYRDAAPEEIAEFERHQEEIPEPEPTPEERLDALETTTDDMILLMAELIGGEQNENP